MSKLMRKIIFETHVGDFAHQYWWNSVTNLRKNKVTVLVLGSSQVGKSTMIDLFMQNKVMIEDDAGESLSDCAVEIIVELIRFEATTEATTRKLLIQNAHAFVLMYSLDNTESLRSIGKFKEEIENIKGKGMPMIVVGNKIDTCKTETSIASERKGAFCMDGFPHIKVSFADRSHTNDVYKTLFEHEILKNFTNVVSNITNHKMFSDFRKLLMKADALEETVAKCFGSYCKFSKSNTKKI